MSLPAISVVIPLYNHQRFITAALYSVIDQTYPPKEIIVVDDGSQDRSAQLVAAIADVRPEIAFWSHPNRGAHNTLNAGIHRASGDLIAILNSDDVYEKTRLQRAAETFRDKPEIDLVATNLSFIDADGADISYPWFQQAAAFYKECGDLGLALVNGNFLLTTSNVVVRRKLFNEIGYFSDLRYAHDLDFFLRLVSRGKRIEHLEERLIQYRVHGSNTISEGHEKVKLEWAAAVAMYLRVLWSNAASGDHWAASPGYLDVLHKHRLTGLVFVLFAYFQAHGLNTLERNAWQLDASLMRALEAISQ